MKKNWLTAAAGILAAGMVLSGCGAQTEQAELPVETAAETTATAAAIGTQAAAAVSADGVDVDLTALSSTMVYAEVYNMMTTPAEYMGKTVKVSGQYYASYYDETQQYYHYVIVADATACCQQGIEFVWVGDHTYPDDYPADGTEVELTGVFGSYDELGITYYYLQVEDITLL